MVTLSPRRRTHAAKITLRGLLSRNASRLGLTTAAVDAIVQRSQITHCRAGEQIFASGDAHDLVNFLIAGAVRVTCHGRGGRLMTVQIVRPGQFFGLASLFDPPAPREFGAVAHRPAIVAIVSQDVLTTVMADLPPGRALRLMAYSWRVLSRLLYEKCLLLTMPLGERVVHELEILAHDFGVPHPDGVVIDLPLTQADLAELVVGSRANVSRVLAALRRRGELVADRRRIVLTPRFAASRPSIADRFVPFGT